VNKFSYISVGQGTGMVAMVRGLDPEGFLAWSLHPPLGRRITLDKTSISLGQKRVRILIMSIIGVAVCGIGFLTLFANRRLGKAFEDINLRRRENE
jgi:hypothetical protein